MIVLPFLSHYRTYSCRSSSDNTPIGLVLSDMASFPPRVREMRESLLAFMEEHVFPAESQLWAHQNSDQRWKPHPLVDELKVGVIRQQEVM